MATLGYSRASFVKFGQKEDGEALCEGLREALDYFGGVPEQVLFDNVKTVVIERDAYGPGLHRWNDRLLELAEECGFTLRLCRPYRQDQRQGRMLQVSGLKLVAEVANSHVPRWLDEVANERVHATTKAIPARRLAEERSAMLPAPALKVTPVLPLRVPVLVESLQHPPAVYDALLEVQP